MNSKYLNLLKRNAHWWVHRWLSVHSQPSTDGFGKQDLHHNKNSWVWLFEFSEGTREENINRGGLLCCPISIFLVRAIRSEFQGAKLCP